MNAQTHKHRTHRNACTDCSHASDGQFQAPSSGASASAASTQPQQRDTTATTTAIASARVRASLPEHALRALYSPEHAAAYLDVSRASIYRWIAAGRLTGFRVGRLRRFTRAELDAFAAALAEEGKGGAA